VGIAARLIIIIRRLIGDRPRALVKIKATPRQLAALLTAGPASGPDTPQNFHVEDVQADADVPRRLLLVEHEGPVWQLGKWSRSCRHDISRRASAMAWGLMAR
jgi:hypothetical protein